jgi:hypothetical protein
LNFVESYWGDVGGKALSQGIEILNAVEELDIDVGFNEMKDYGLLEIARSVLGLKTVKKLILSLNQNELQNEAAL